MKKLKSCFLAFTVLWFGCAPQSPPISGTSEQGNAKFIATLFTQSGAAAIGCKAIVRRSDYITNPDSASYKSQDTGSRIATDENGLLIIDSLDTGAYSVEVTDAKAHAVLMKFGIGPKRESVRWGADTIRRFAVVKGSIDSVGSRIKRFVQVVGLERLVPVDSGGAFIVNNLPQGTYTLRIITSDSSVSALVFDGVAAKAGATSTIDPYGAWKYRASIILNTSASGADIADNLFGFPVLIRLSSANFSFPESGDGGRDLRFSKLDGTPLHFEIERWDPATQHAEVWVKIDTIIAHDSAQSITMHWGNPEAASQSRSENVFDTAIGFQAVWHLGETSDTIYDATYNHYHGIRYGSLKRSSCVIGNGQTFDSAEAYCEMGNVFNPGAASFTVSAWVKRANTGLQTIIAKSNGGNPGSTYGWSLSFGLADQLHCYIANGGSIWGSAGAFDFWSRTDAVVIDTTTWHYAVAIIDRSNGANCRTFIDGVDVTGNSNGNMAEVGSLANSLALRIGAEADGDYQWTGSIDECVISRAVRSSAWIRLCYINQGPNDRLVRFK